MNKKRNLLRVYGFIGLLILLCGFVPKKIAFAGDINADEARVISAASGTFTYNGKTYRAGSAYINQLIGYLSSDDVDLTAREADQAISEMYASIQQGVEEGYLYEVEEEPTSTENTSDENVTEEVSTDEDTQENRTEEISTGEEETKGVSEKDSDDDYTDAEGESDDKKTEDANIWSSVSEQTTMKKKLEKRPEKKEAAAAVQMDEDKIVVSVKDNREIYISKNGEVLSEKALLGINVAATIIFVITLICAGILLATKCMSFRIPKSRRARPGHSKRRKIRRHIRNLLTITTLLSLIGVFTFLGIYISLFNENAIMQNMQSSGYFRYAYSEYISEKSDKHEADAIEPYEEYRYCIKENSLKVLNGDMNVIIPDSNVTPYIYNLKLEYKKLFKTAGSLVILSLIIGTILMIFMDQRRERGIKSFAVAEIIASGILIGITFVMAVGKPYTQLYIEPDYLYLFLMECIQWSVKVMISITAFAVVAGMALIGAYRAVMNRR